MHATNKWVIDRDVRDVSNSCFVPGQQLPHIITAFAVISRVHKVNKTPRLNINRNPWESLLLTNSRKRWLDAAAWELVGITT